MFAAVNKGHGKGKLANVLGVRKIKEICAELEEGNSFLCSHVWGTGAYGKVRTPLRVRAPNETAIAVPIPEI